MQKRNQPAKPTAEKTLEFLLSAKENRTEKRALDGKPFQIGAYIDDAFGLLVVTVYQDNKPVKTHNGLIMSKSAVLNWLDNSL